MELNGVTIRMGGFICKVLADLAEFPKNDWDNVILVTGLEGDGKTEFVKGASYIMDPGVSVSRWAYNAKQFELVVDNEELPEGANVVWDESDETSSAWFSKVMFTLKRKFKRIRKKKLTIWLITPTFFDMNKYFAIHRARCLFDVYADPKRDLDGVFHANRGRVRFFNRDKKRQLYINGIKTWNMFAEKPNFIDSFGKVPPNYPIKAEELEAKKDEAMKDLLDGENDRVDPIPKFRQECIVRAETWAFTHGTRKLPQDELAYIFDVNVRTIKRDVSVIKKEVAADGLFGRKGTVAEDTNITKLQGPGSGQMGEERLE